jgi:hypothetical protein
MAFTASDSEFAAPGFRAISPGDVFGLAHVTYTVSATTKGGTDSLTFVSDALTDSNGSTIPVTISNGSMASLVPVPEPSSMLQAGTGAALCAGLLGWRRRRNATR